MVILKCSQVLPDNLVLQNANLLLVVLCDTGQLVLVAVHSLLQLPQLPACVK